MREVVTNIRQGMHFLFYLRLCYDFIIWGSPFEITNSKLLLFICFAHDNSDLFFR
jgi:hypothetical protein